MMSIITPKSSLLSSSSMASVAFGLTLLSACGSSPKQTAKIQGPQEIVSKSETEQTFDTNNDAQPDVWRQYVLDGKVKRLAAKSFDLNFDRKVDFKRFYTEDGKVLRDELDMDFDGKYDRIVYYKNNVIDRKEVSLQGDEKPEVFKYYKNGQLSYVEGDRDGNGMKDYFQYYKNGQLVRRGFDSDGDGQPDRWVRLEDN